MSSAVYVETKDKAEASAYLCHACKIIFRVGTRAGDYHLLGHSDVLWLRIEVV